MELDKIEQLLENYFEGNTSSAEEKQLKNYFASEDVAPHLEEYRAVFGYFSEAKKEQFTAEIPLTKKKKNYIAWLSVAASVMVMFGVGFYVYNNSFTSSNEDLGTFDNPELAFKETQKALDLISTHVNTGIESMHYINEFEQSKNKVFK
jgi:hypothetical protein